MLCSGVVKSRDFMLSHARQESARLVFPYCCARARNRSVHAFDTSLSVPAEASTDLHPNPPASTSAVDALAS